MKVCPYCAGDIQDEAVVCRYCHSDLPPFRASSGRRRCPYCAESIASSLTTCNHCQREISLDPGAGFFEPTSQPEDGVARFEPAPAAQISAPPPPPPSHPTSLRDILSSLDEQRQPPEEAEVEPRLEEPSEPALGGEADWLSHKTPPFSMSPAEEVSFAMGDLAQDEANPIPSDVDAWKDEEPAPDELASQGWNPEEASAPAPDISGWGEPHAPASSRDSGIFRRELGSASPPDSGSWRRSQDLDSSRDKGSSRRGEESGAYGTGSWRSSQISPPDRSGSRSINYISQSSLRRSAISERLAELDSTSPRQRTPPPAKPEEPAGLHPGAFIVVAVALLSVALIFFLGPGRSTFAFLLEPPAPSQVASPVVQATPTSLPTALHPLIKETSAPTVSSSPAAAGCLSWDQVTAADVGKELCVEGTVKRWFATQDFPMVVIFSEEPATFIFVDADEAPSTVKPGTCVSASGAVKIMGGERPYIEFDGPPTICEPLQ